MVVTTKGFNLIRHCVARNNRNGIISRVYFPAATGQQQQGFLGMDMNVIINKSFSSTPTGGSGGDNSDNDNSVIPDLSEMEANSLKAKGYSSELKEDMFDFTGLRDFKNKNFPDKDATSLRKIPKIDTVDHGIDDVEEAILRIDVKRYRKDNVFGMDKNKANRLGPYSTAQNIDYPKGFQIDNA